MDNRNNTPIPAATLAAVNQKLQEIRDLLSPYLITVKPEERRELPKMGDKSLAFVLKAADLATANTKLLPIYLDVPALQLDAATAQALRPVQQALEGLVYDVESTRMVAGSEGYTAALMAYGAFKAAAEAGQPAAQAAVTELRPRFEGQGPRGPRGGN